MIIYAYRIDREAVRRLVVREGGVTDGAAATAVAGAHRVLEGTAEVKTLAGIAAGDNTEESLAKTYSIT